MAQMPNRVLCVCMGNGDRSPVMAAVLGMFLKNAGHDVICESAGADDPARNGGGAAEHGMAAAKKIGLDLSSHTRRHIDQVDLKSYDLFVCASDEIASRVIKAGVDKGKVYNVNITDPWPVHFQVDYDEDCMPSILAKMFRVVCRYFA